jgi:hypothetical protein
MTESVAPSKVKPDKAFGIDLEISHALVTSEGQCFDYPRYLV